MQEKKSLHWLKRHSLEIKDLKFGRSLIEQEDEYSVVINLPDGKQRWVIRDFNSFGLSFKIPDISYDYKRLEKFLRNLQIFQGHKHITTIHAASTNFIKPYQDKYLLVDIQFFPNSSQAQIDSDYQRVELHDEWQPCIHFLHPFLYDRPVKGKVIKVNKKGMLVSLHLQHNDIFPNVEIKKLKLNIPSVGDLTCSVAVHDIFWISNFPTQLFLNLKFLKTEKLAVEMFGQLLVLHGKQIDNSVNIMKLIKDAELFPKNIKKHLHFSYLNSDEDYVQVLELRHLAYRHSGKIPKGTPVSSMTDRYDDRSRIIVCKHHGKVIGSVRMTFCEHPREQFELEESIQLPDKFLKERNDIGEISRMCIHPEYQRTDLVVGLIERSFMYVIKTGKKYIITSCDKKMLRFYKMLGFSRSGITFDLKTLHGVPHEFIYVKTKKGLTGLGMHPSVFFKVIYNIVNFNMQGRSKNVRLSLFYKLFYKVNACVGRVLYWLYGRKK